MESFTFPGEEGRQTKVDVYSPYDEVELFVNGISYGRQKTGLQCQYKATFVITYEPGCIQAIAYRKNKQVNESKRCTVGEPELIGLSIDYKGERLIYIVAEIWDGNHERVVHCTESIHFECSGAGELIALGSGDPTSEESFTACSRNAHNGRILAIIKRVGYGDINVKASSLKLGETGLLIEAD